MAITGGFGICFDVEKGFARNWVIGRDGIKRWADDGKPCAPEESALEVNAKHLHEKVNKLGQEKLLQVQPFLLNKQQQI